MDGKKREKFSVIVPFRDTEREKDFARESIPSMIGLGPDEIVIGMDSPVAEATMKFLRDLFSRWNYEDYRVVEVPQSDDWGFHAAHVVWECYKSCRYVRVLETNIDVVLWPAMLGGLQLIGENGPSVVAYKRHPLAAGMRDRVRHVLRRLLSRNLHHSGLDCVWRPHYFAAMDLIKFKQIRNGWDTFMHECMAANGYRIVMGREEGGKSMDVGNPSLPWRQFAFGVWFYAHPELVGQSRSKILQRVLRAVNRRVPLSMHARALRYQYPYMVTGYKWAKAHPQHDSVHVASGLSLIEWTYTGSEYIKDAMDWAHEGKTGTGFD